MNEISWHNFPLFNDIEQSTKTEINAISKVKHLKKNETLFLAKDKGSQIYLVNHGRIKLSRETQNGNEAVFNIAERGSLIGENLIFGEANYSCNATAIEDSEIITLPLSQFKLVADNSNRLMSNASRILLGIHREYQMNVEHMAVQSAPQRVGCFLLNLVKTQTGKAEFELPYEKSLIASKLGIKSETFSRALNELKNHGVTVRGKYVIIEKVESLADFTCSACSDSFPCE